MKKRVTLFLSCLFISIGLIFAQTTVPSNGTVVDETGEPLIGVSVAVKGTTTGTITDIDGNFTLNVPSNSSVLVFSLVGMSPEEHKASTNMRITMQQDSQILDEVMVVAYGTAKRSSFTGSASIVKADDIVKRQTSNVVNALNGRVAGVQMQSNNGQPGTTPTIRIRGVGSDLASNAPLYVVDGVPYDGDMSAINPSDIESMTVLKDAASNALYGARGANGVIMLTTKAGKSEEAVISVDAKWGTNRRAIPNYDVIRDPATYYELAYSAIYNSLYYGKNGGDAAAAHKYALNNIFTNSGGGVGYQIYTYPKGEDFIMPGGKINPNAKLGYSDGQYYYTPDNWYDETFDSGNLRQEYNVSISGRSNKMNYYLSGSYLDDTGIIENSGFKRYTTRLKADYQAKKWLKLTTNIAYTNYVSKYPSNQTTTGSSGNLFYYANMISPIYPLYVRDVNGNIMHDPNGSIRYDYGDGVSSKFLRSFMNKSNPMSALELDVRDYRSDILSGRWGADINVYEGLKASFKYGIDLDNTRNRSLKNPYYGQYAEQGGYVYQESNKTFSTDGQILLTYNKSIGKHNFDILAAYEIYKYTYETLSGSKDKLYNPHIPEIGNAINNPQITSRKVLYQTESYFGRAQYDYDGVYFGSVSFRRDGSSRFHPDNRWGNFWSASAAWLLSKNVLNEITWLDLLKVKASFGEQGNDNLLYNDGQKVNYYPYADQFEVQNNNGNFATPMTYKGNKDLTWEKSQSLNVGIDFESFKGKLYGTLEYYRRRTSNLLYNKPVPPSLGYPTIPTNIGSRINQGIEAELNSDIFKTKDLNLTVFFNLTTQSNKIQKLAPELEGQYINGDRIYIEGESAFQLYMRSYAGVDENGVALYYKDIKDANGNVTGRETTTDWSKATKYKSGDLLPDVYGGFGLSASYKGFDFSISLGYQLGGTIYDKTYANLMHSGSSSDAGTNWHKDALNAWSQNNTSSNIPRLNSVDDYTNSLSDRFYTSSDYLSLQNITFGYTIPKNLIRKLDLSSVRLYFVADNIALLSARKGLDPRQDFTESNSGTTYSPIRSLSGGISLSF